jgi:hypothetical protein
VKRFLALTVIAAVLSGLVGAWAITQLTEQAGAAPPPPQPQQVREQNLDGSGFIRVHEQGTANVNVVSLPQTPSESPRTYTLFDNQDVTGVCHIPICRHRRLRAPPLLRAILACGLELRPIQGAAFCGWLGDLCSFTRRPSIR